LQVNEEYGEEELEVSGGSSERRSELGSSNMLSTLVFPQVPRGDLYKLQAFGLSDGFFIFSYVANFLGLFQPDDYPLGESFIMVFFFFFWVRKSLNSHFFLLFAAELANDAMQSRLSLADVIMKVNILQIYI